MSSQVLSVSASSAQLPDGVRRCLLGGSRPRRFRRGVSTACPQQQEAGRGDLFARPVQPGVHPPRIGHRRTWPRCGDRKIMRRNGGGW